MSNEEKKIDWLRVIVLIVMGIMLLVVGVERYNSHFWEKKFTYENWEFYDYESVENGMNCILKNCNNLNTEDKTEVKECLCRENNKTVRVIATRKTLFYEYTQFKPLKYEVRLNETI